MTNTTNTAVTWTASVGTISASGMYTAPASITTQQTATVTAKSAADATKTASATITLMPPVAVSVTPATATLYQGQTQQFTATVTNTTNTAVTWTASVGTISASGLYTAPSGIATQQTATVTAKSAADATKTATATITLMPPVAVSVSPTTATLYASNTQQFTATVTNTTNTAVTWTASVGTISASGLYTAPASIATQQTSTVTAKSAADPTKTATATITLMPPVAVSVSPTTATLYASQTQQFTATVTNTSNTAVTWTASVGTISASGLYTAPATISTQQTVTVTATSQANTAASSSATVTLMPPVAVSVSPTTATLYASQTQQFTATVTNTSNTAVTWTASVGTISASGLYTAPASITTQQTATVTAKSAADATKTATATITLMPPVAVSINVPGGPLYVGGTLQFTATVTGTTNLGVTWTLAGPGTLSPTGLYTAPSTITTPFIITVTGTSQADTTKSASATVTSATVTVNVTPATATLYAGQAQQFTATVGNAASTDTAVTWTVTPSGVGTFTSGGLYTAPASIMTQQTVTFTATSVADPAKSLSVPITLTPPVAVSVTPPTATLYQGNTQQFTATVTNTTNTAVTWTITPAGTGTVDTTGLYTAPSSVTAQQTVTVTATSQADTTQSASATVTLTPSGSSCSSTGFVGYPYRRAITIDHTKVPNTDQTNFPLLVSLTDSLLATVTNGGHVTSANGYDIIFASDAGGTNKLDHEIEFYDPVAGQIIMWVRIPTISHTSDTTIYLLYGNTAITTSQENKTGVWDSNFLAVLHLDETSGNEVFDSTANGNNGTTSPSATTGKIGSAQSFDGTSTFIALPHPMTNGLKVFSVSFWTQTTDGTSDDTYYDRPQLVGDYVYSNSGAFGINTNGGDLAMYSGLNSGGNNSLVSNSNISDNNWHQIVAVDDGSLVRMYLDGQDTGQTLPSGLALDNYGWDLGAQHKLSDFGTPASFYQGNIDEFRFSNSARSADWIATEYNNQNSPSTFYSVAPENTQAISISPASTALSYSQTQRFQPAFIGGCSALIWSISPAGSGTIDTTGLYTAPATIPAQQIVTVEAAIQGSTNVLPATAAVLLMPVAVSVTPANPILYSGQSQQFTANVTNATNTAVTWSMSPAGLGTLDATGRYAAPATVTTEQSVVVTATSVFDPTKSASATVWLMPGLGSCASNGYAFHRAIVVDHTKVPNTDQTNFPLLVSLTDPILAPLANGGHVSSANGYDIIFTSDPAGANKLDHEIESYNPATGQIVMWVRIPTLSHTADTIIYLNYGNGNITTSQENKASVWDVAFTGVYHLGSNGPTLSANDSTLYANNGTVNNATATAGEIDGAALFDGSTAYISLPQGAFNYPTIDSTSTSVYNLSFEAWFKTTTGGVILGQQDDGALPPSEGWGVPALYVDTTGYLRASFFNEGNQIVSQQQYNDGNWHHVVDAYTNGTETLYVDGTVSGSQNGVQSASSDVYSYSLGTGYTDGWPNSSTGWFYLKGEIDEVRVSNIARSADWIATEPIFPF